MFKVHQIIDSLMIYPGFEKGSFYSTFKVHPKIALWFLQELKKLKCSAQARTKMITKQKNACKKVCRKYKNPEELFWLKSSNRFSKSARMQKTHLLIWSTAAWMNTPWSTSIRFIWIHSLCGGTQYVLTQYQRIFRAGQTIQNIFQYLLLFNF